MSWVTQFALRIRRSGLQRSIVLLVCGSLVTFAAWMTRGKMLGRAAFLLDFTPFVVVRGFARAHKYPPRRLWAR